MNETYGELLAQLMDEMARYDERADIFRRNEIPKGHYYNVINPKRRTSTDNRFYCPTEWGVRLTRDSHNYKWIKTIARDCGGVFVSPEDVHELKGTEPEKVLEAFKKIVGMVRK